MRQNKIETNESGIEKDVPSILTKRKILPGDRVLWVIVAMFFAISLVAVYTASSKLGFSDGTMDSELRRHFGTLCASAAILFGFYILGASLMHKFTWLAYLGSFVLTLIPYFQAPINGAHRWLEIGGFTFQPSELLKIATIMLLALRLSERYHMIKKIHLMPTTFDVRKWNSERERKVIFDEMLPIISPIAFTCMVILPDATSSAVHIFFVSMIMLVLAGIRFNEIAKLILVAAVVGLSVMFTFGRGDTVIRRVGSWMGIERFVEAEDGGSKDTYYSKMAIQNGGFFGVGAGRSMMRTKLMHPESDYLFAIVVEEFGLLLSSVIILLYLWLFFRSLRIFERCEWLYGGLVAVGLALLVTSQGFLHISVALGILPETGQNLPFLTHGRTGMFCASVAVGIILSISRQSEQGTLLPPSQNNKDKHI